MKRLSLPLVALFLALSCSEDPVLNTFGSISGTIQDAKSVSPLSGVKVSITPTGMSQVTGADGTFLFDNLQVQEYTLVFTKDGYKTDQQKVSVKPGVTSTVQVSLTPLSGSFIATPEELYFGDSQTSIKVQLRNVSGVSTYYTAESSNSWLSVSPDSGNIVQSDYLTAIVSREGLSPGDFNGEILIKYLGEALSIPVHMTVKSASAPTVTIESVSAVTANSATVNANLTSIGSSPVVSMGICWSSENKQPTLSDHKSNQGDAKNPCSFSAVLTSLDSETKYYCRAYAQNDSGISYSEVASFTTSQPGGPSTDGIAVPSGLMLYFNFDSEEVKDMTDNDIEAIVIGDPAYLSDTPDGKGRSLFLNGTKDQYITIPYALFDGLDHYSISFWAKDFSSGSFVSALSTYGPSYSYLNRPKVYLQSTGKLFFDTYGRNVSYQDRVFNYPFTSLQSGSWHHIAVTLEVVASRDAREYLYVDGKFIDTVNEDTCIQYTNKVQIGGDSEGGYPVAMTTKIDNFRIYNRTITKEEVKEIYNSELGSSD